MRINLISLILLCQIGIIYGGNTNSKPTPQELGQLLHPKNQKYYPELALLETPAAQNYSKRTALSFLGPRPNTLQRDPENLALSAGSLLIIQGMPFTTNTQHEQFRTNIGALSNLITTWHPAALFMIAPEAYNPQEYVALTLMKTLLTWPHRDKISENIRAQLYNHLIQEMHLTSGGTPIDHWHHIIGTACVYKAIEQSIPILEQHDPHYPQYKNVLAILSYLSHEKPDISDIRLTDNDHAKLLIVQKLRQISFSYNHLYALRHILPRVIDNNDPIIKQLLENISYLYEKEGHDTMKTHELIYALCQNNHEQLQQLFSNYLNTLKDDYSFKQDVRVQQKTPFNAHFYKQQASILNMLHAAGARFSDKQRPFFEDNQWHSRIKQILDRQNAHSGGLTKSATHR